MIEALLHIDRELFLFINHHHNEAIDAIMVFASAKYTWLPLYLFIVYLLIKKYQFKAIPVIVMLIATIALSDQTSVHLFKNVFLRLRPCHEPSLQELVRTIDGCGGQYGFVSSHAANTMAGVTFLFFAFRPLNKWMTLLFITYLLLVTYSRIYLGVHYPLDIIGGILLGFSCGIFTTFLLKKILLKL